MKYEAPFIADAAMVEDASRLRRSFGEGAVLEAAMRASVSRDRGNVVHFCRWREVERMVGLLDIEEATGTLH